MNRGHVVCFVSKNHTSVDEDEGAEGGDQSDERFQNFDDINHSLGLGGYFQRARDDGNNSFSIVWTESKLLLNLRDCAQNIPSIEASLTGGSYKTSILQVVLNTLPRVSPKPLLLLYMDSLTSSCP